MKRVMTNICVYVMAIVILIASVGVNVFKHICSTCHESYYTLDVTPVSDDETCTHEGCNYADCNCQHHGHSHAQEAKYATYMHNGQNADIEAHRCGMDGHQHDYYHIEQLYKLPSKITVESIAILATIPQFYITTEEVIERKTLFYKHNLINRQTPDLPVENCCFLC